MTRDFGLYSSFAIDRPHLHHGNKAFANLHWKLLAELKDFFRQRLDHAVALFQLKISQALSNAAFYSVPCVDVAAVEIQQQRFRIAVFQALIPALGNDERLRTW
jgi:hypothetical protein